MIVPIVIPLPPPSPSRKRKEAKVEHEVRRESLVNHRCCCCGVDPQNKGWLGRHGVYCASCAMLPGNPGAVAENERAAATRAAAWAAEEAHRKLDRASKVAAKLLAQEQADAERRTATLDRLERRRAQAQESPSRWRRAFGWMSGGWS